MPSLVALFDARKAVFKLYYELVAEQRDGYELVKESKFFVKEVRSTVATVAAAFESSR